MIVIKEKDRFYQKIYCLISPIFEALYSFAKMEPDSKCMIKIIIYDVCMTDVKLLMTKFLNFDQSNFFIALILVERKEKDVDRARIGENKAARAELSAGAI